MTTKLRYALLVLLLVQAVLLNACTPAAAPVVVPVATTEPIKLKALTLPFISFAPLYIAVEEGYFQEQGLDVELVELTQNQETLPALLSGEVDIAAGLTSAGILNTIARGGEIKIVADKGYIDPNGCDNIALIARQSLASEGDVQSAQTLSGRKIDVVTATWNEFYLEKLLNSIGLTVADIEKVHIPSPSMPEAMNEGSLDLVTQNEPWVSRMVSAGHINILTPVTELLPESQSAVLFYGPTMFGENEEAGKRFMVAYLKAVRQYNLGKTDRNIEILAKYNNLDAETLKAMCWPTLRDSGEVNIESLLEFQDWAVQAGYQEEPLTVDQFWESSYIEYAQSILDGAE
jgi:NitT/TauT family transport system substrate-binding protein